jgi:hypothetical protein
MFTAGFQGAVNCDLPMSTEAVTPGFALRWLCEIITVVRVFNDEKKRIEMGI